MSDTDRRSRPAQRIVARIQKYYADLATEQIRSSSASPEAEQWRKDVKAVEEDRVLSVESLVDLQGSMR
jgi:ubiquinone biosynthesis protein UbiJ